MRTMTTLGIPLFIYPISMFSIETKRFSSRANSASSPISINVGILRVVFMSLRAMSLKRLIFPSFPASRVLSVKHWLQMSWIAAKRASTKVVKFFPFLDRTNKHLVYNAMNRSCFPSYADMPVFIFPLAATSSAEPKPAVRLAIKKSVCPDAIRQIRKFHALTINKLEAVASTTEL